MGKSRLTIHFRQFATFNAKRLSANEANTAYTVGTSTTVIEGTPEIQWNRIVFIKDTQQVWTHGQLYNFVHSDSYWKAMRQLVCNWLMPEWTDEDSEGNPIVWEAGSYCRCNGWIFQAQVDTSECPYTQISSETGLPIVSDDYELVVDENINNPNWAKMSTIPPELGIEEIMERASLVPGLRARITQLEETVATMTTALQNLTRRVQSLEDFRTGNQFVIDDPITSSSD